MKNSGNVWKSPDTFEAGASFLAGRRQRAYDQRGGHKKDYPDMSHEDYLNMARKIYSDPLSTKITYPSDAPMYPGETHYRNNGNLLRIAPDGTFRSLYPD